MDAYRTNQLRGLLTEALVWQVLQREHPSTVLTPATKEENIEHDIDLWLGDEAISIKTQHKGVETGNFSFELEQQLGYPWNGHPAGAWVRMNGFYKSAADRYAIVQGRYLYLVPATTVKHYVKRHDWDKVVTLSPKVKEYQIGKMHIDARNGLIARERLVPKDIYGLGALHLEAIELCVSTGDAINIDGLRNLAKVSRALDLIADCMIDNPSPVARQYIVHHVMLAVTL